MATYCATVVCKENLMTAIVTEIFSENDFGWLLATSGWDICFTVVYLKSFFTIEMNANAINPFQPPSSKMHNKL